MMKLNILILITTLFFMNSCNGQEIPASSTKRVFSNVGEKVKELSNSILIIFHAKNGDYWFGSDRDGLYRLQNKKTITHFSVRDGLSDNRIRSIQEDKAGNIYISTLAGINKYDGISFTTLLPVKTDDSTTHWKLQPDDLWFHAPGRDGEKGPYRYDGKNLYALIFPKHSMEEEYYKIFPNNAWSPYDVYYIYKDRNGHMWFGTSNFGLCRYDGKSICWLYEEHLTLTPNGGSFGIRSIFEDRYGKYWFCNTRFRYRVFSDSIHENNMALINYKKESGIEGIKSSDNQNHIYFMSMTEDNKGNLWMATYNEGVWKYDGKNVTHYNIFDGEKNTTFFSIYKDREGVLWLGSHESGAYKFNGTEFEKFVP